MEYIVTHIDYIHSYQNENKGVEQPATNLLRRIVVILCCQVVAVKKSKPVKHIIDEFNCIKKRIF